MRDDPHLTPARRAERAARDKRLAAALRENLRRRKEQARVKATNAVQEAAPPDPESGAPQPQG
ncbi:MAG TPA: hypothetical protein VET89_06475 [Stellaceae bacterium]|nr:hypothetical protein [Stellaceae bacterium]